MDTVPNPDPWSGHPIVDLVERQLRAFGDLTRDQAVDVLPYWAHYARLTDRERAAVLDRLPAADAGWLSGTCGSTR